jgi:hypothetical protein
MAMMTNKTRQLIGTPPARFAVGHFGHSGHQIGKLFYKSSIEDFPKLLSYLSKVSTPLYPPTTVQLRNRQEPG